MIGHLEQELLVAPHRDARLREVSQAVGRRIGLGDGVTVFLVGRQELDLVGDLRLDAHLGQHIAQLRDLVGQLGIDHLAGLGDHRAVGRSDALAQDLADQRVGLIGHAVEHLAVRRLDEAVLVDLAVGRQRADQADVRAFRGLDGADAAVVAVVHVAHVEAGPLAAEAAGAQGAQAALVRQLGQRVGLIHKLAELRPAKELTDRRHHRSDVDQRQRRGLVGVADRHPLTDHALHPQQAHAELVLDQLAHGFDAAVAQVIDIVLALDAVVDVDHAAQHRDQVIVGQRAVVQRHIQVQAAVELVAADLAQIIAPRGEDQVLHEALGVVQRRRIPGAQLLVELQQRAVHALGRVRPVDRAGGVAFQSRCDVAVIGVVVNLGELLQDFVIGAEADRAQQHGDGQLALAIHLHRNDVALAGLELQPRAAIRDHLGVAETPIGDAIFLHGEINARGSDQLADDHALGPVNDEGAVFRHQREIAHEDVLGGNLAGLAIDQLDAHPQRGGEGHVTVPALRLGVLGLAEPKSFWPRDGAEVQLQVLVEAHDRGDLIEELLQTLRLEPTERVQLHLDQARQVVHIANASVRLARGKGAIAEMRHEASTPCRKAKSQVPFRLGSSRSLRGEGEKTLC